MMRSCPSGMVFDRADRPGCVCIQALRVYTFRETNSGHETTMDGRFGNSKMLGLFILYTTPSWSETGPGMRSPGRTANLFVHGLSLNKSTLDVGAGLGFFNCRARVEYWSLAPRRGACALLELLVLTAPSCEAY